MHDSSGSAADRERLAERLRELMAGEPPLTPAPRRASHGPEEFVDPADEVEVCWPDELGRSHPDNRSEQPQPLGADLSTTGTVAPEREPAPDDLSDPEPVGPRSARHRVVGAVREFGRTHLGIVAVVCAALLVFAGSQVLRARASTVPDAPLSALEGFGAAVSPSAPASPSATPSVVPRIQVHVTGAVRAPGVHSLPQDARIVDAIQAAGGLDDTADFGELNLAAPACDGCQLVIGTRQAPRGELRAPAGGSASGAGGGSQTGAASGGASSAGGSRIDLNTASASALEELPGIGPVIAGRIVDWRTEHKRFSRVEELQEVTGIGPALFEKVKDHVVVS